MNQLFLIFSCLVSLLTLGLIARFVAALSFGKSLQLIKDNPRRHLAWLISVVLLWAFMIEFPQYMAYESRRERKQKFVEFMQRDLKSDARFSNLAIDTNHFHFMSITGKVSSLEEKQALRDLIQTNRRMFPAPVTEDVLVMTN